MAELLSTVPFVACESSSEQPSNESHAGAGREAGSGGDRVDAGGRSDGGSRSDAGGRTDAGDAGAGATSGCAGPRPQCRGQDSSDCCLNDPISAECVDGSWQCFGLPPPGCNGIACFSIETPCGTTTCGAHQACRISWGSYSPESGGAGGEGSGGVLSGGLAGDGGAGGSRVVEGAAGQGGAAGAGSAAEAPRYDCVDTARGCHDCGCLTVPDCSCSQDGDSLTLTCGR